LVTCKTQKLLKRVKLGFKGNHSVVELPSPLCRAWGSALIISPFLLLLLRLQLRVLGQRPKILSSLDVYTFTQNCKENEQTTLSNLRFGAIVE
jgi:hypothetical protein